MNVIYLHGFASSPLSRKARFFADQLEQVGVACQIADLEQGRFRDLTLTSQLDVVHQLVQGRPVTLIGSSMGGYLATLYAARHAEVQQVIAMAPAFNFATLWRNRLGDTQFRRWRRKGSLPVFHYGSNKQEEISFSLYSDALLYEPFPTVSQPALLFHGVYDDVVPLSFSELFVMQNSAASLLPVGSGHELTDSLDILWRETARFLKLSK